MKACILSIGNELLNGHTADTNTPWLCARLLEKGIAVQGGWLVPDDHDQIIKSLQQAAELAELILITGGLGPTDDDITRKAVADFLGVPLELRQELVDHLQAFFARLGRPMVEKNLSQAYIPKRSEILRNPKGTAAGFWCRQDKLKIAVMPGVPAEMKSIYDQQILPRLDKFALNAVAVNATVRCFGLGESDIAQRLGTLMARGRNPLINSTCGAGDIVLHIAASGRDRSQSLEMIERDKQILSDLLGEYIYGYGEESMSQVVGRMLRQAGKKIVAAESCTGGLLSELLTDCPGSSDYMMGGWVTYSNDLKISQLNISQQLIAENGAVSEPVARAMAVNAARLSGADIAVGITGIAGPEGGTEHKPVGLVFISLFQKGDCCVYRYHFPAVSRQAVRQRAVLTALNLVRTQLRI